MDEVKKSSLDSDMPTFMCTPNKEESNLHNQMFLKTKTVGKIV